MSNVLDKYFKLKDEQFTILKTIKLTALHLIDHRHDYWMSDGVHFRYESSLHQLKKSISLHEIEETYNISGCIIFRKTVIDWILPDDCLVFNPSKQVPWKD